MKQAPLKIGIVCPYNIFRHGGVQETIYAHQRILKSRGHDVKILSPRPLSFNGRPPEDVILLGISTDLNYPFKTKADISIHVGQLEMVKVLHRHKFDILHFHEPWVPLFPRQLLNMSSSVNIGTFHAKWPESVIYKTFGKAIGPYARSIVADLDFIAAASEPASQYVNELIGRQVPIIFNGIDLERYNPARVKPLKRLGGSIKTILYINRLEKRKGPDLLLKAYVELTKRRRNVRLIMASDGDMRADLEQFVVAHRLPRVEFTGFISEATKLRLYASADLYCAPSPYGEGFGIVLLEAMAMQVPYVAGDNVGYRYASGPRADEYLVDPTKATAFADRLETMLFDDKRRERYKKWSRSYANQYDYQSIVAQYETTYQRLLKEKRDAS